MLCYTVGNKWVIVEMDGVKFEFYYIIIISLYTKMILSSDGLPV